MSHGVALLNGPLQEMPGRRPVIWTIRRAGAGGGDRENHGSSLDYGPVAQLAGRAAALLRYAPRSSLCVLSVLVPVLRGGKCVMLLVGDVHSLSRSNCR